MTSRPSPFATRFAVFALAVGPGEVAALAEDRPCLEATDLARILLTAGPGDPASEFHGRDALARSPTIKRTTPTPARRRTTMTTSHPLPERTTAPQPPIESLQDRTRTLFAQTMGFVALTAGLFALGAYLGRDLAGGVALLVWVASLGALIGMHFAVRRSTAVSVVLLVGFGLLTGLATAPTLAYYASAHPHALWQAGGATALFIAGFGAAGYATRRDLTVIARVGFWALVGLVAFGVVLIFVQIPGGALIYSVLGLLIFAVLTMVDFQRLRGSTDADTAPLMAASIFLDILNVFLFFVQIFSRPND